jgi:O-acetylserine/cysteine efflux transporter
MNTNRRYAVAALIAAGLLWGTTVPLSKLALEWLSPGWLTAARFGLAAAVLLAAILLTAGWTSGRAKLRAAFTPKVLAWGMLGYGGSVMVQNAGISRTSVTHAALLIGATPVLVAIIAAAWHRTVARPVAWVGFVVSLLGIGLVTAGGGGGGATMAGDGLVLASLLLGAAATVAQGRLLTGRDPVAVTAVQFLGAAVGALLVTVFTEGAPAAPGSPGPVLAVLALTVGGTVLPFTLFAFGQSRVSAEVAGAFLNLEPLVGAIVGAAAFGDPVGLVQVAGGAAIVAGIGLSSLPLLAGRRRSQAAPLALAPAGAEPLALALAPAGAEPLALAPAGARPALAGAELAGAGLAGAGSADAGLAGAGSADAGLAGAGSADAGLAARESGTLPDRTTRAPLSLNSGVRRGGRNGVFVVVHGGKFGARRPGGTRPTPGRAGTRRRESARPAGSRPGGRAAERPPGRGWTAERPPGQGRAAERPPGQGRAAERPPGQGRAAERPPARGQGRGGCGALELVQVRASSGR